MDEPGFRVEVYRDEDNVLDLTADNFTVRIYQKGRPAVTVHCATLPTGELDIVIGDNRT